ncbi:MAG: ferric reductase-like transmembrane domain-containing protein [Chloroflexi bacterium]|nr:ferric reductase-like transmembrane domain-containing protein [Chloroflexota bacterium]
MTWFKSNWRWAALNLFAVSVLTVVLTQGSTDWSATHTFDPELESGKWALRFLLICLAMTPLNLYFGWNSASKLRKPAGLWSFGFAIVHVAYYILEDQLSWLVFPTQLFILLGLLGLLVLGALAVTSNRWAMRRLGKNWKGLHRLVYFAGNAVAFHAILATTASKKLAIRDPQAVQELTIYLGVLVILLAVRIPAVRRVLTRILVLPRSHRQADLPIISIIAPYSAPEYPLQIFARAEDIPGNEFVTRLPLVKEMDDASTRHDVPATR